MVIKNSSRENIQKIKTALTIIIVNWYNKKILQDCLESIYNTQINYSYEIIVVDNNSEDGSVKLIKNKLNLGTVKTRNVGLKKAKGKYVAVMDSDDVSFANRFEVQYCN